MGVGVEPRTPQNLRCIPGRPFTPRFSRGVYPEAPVLGAAGFAFHAQVESAPPPPPPRQPPQGPGRPQAPPAGGAHSNRVSHNPDFHDGGKWHRPTKALLPPLTFSGEWKDGPTSLL